MTIEGPSYPVRVRVVATGLLGGVVVLALRALWRQPPGALDAGTLAGVAILALSVAAAYISIVRSRTRLEDEALVQQAWFRREVKLADITEVKLVVPRWLGLPRLRVRTGGLRVSTFHLGDEKLVAAMRELVAQGSAGARNPR